MPPLVENVVRSAALPADMAVDLAAVRIRTSMKTDRTTRTNHIHKERTRDGYSIREELPLPTQPPYTAHIGNLSFEATSADISDLFVDCEVTNVRVVEDKMTRSPKGFGYVEFASLDGLKKALTFGGTPLQGRNIRVSIAEPRTSR